MNLQSNALELVGNKWLTQDIQIMQNEQEMSEESKSYASQKMKFRQNYARKWEKLKVKGNQKWLQRWKSLAVLLCMACYYNEILINCTEVKTVQFSEKYFLSWSTL